MCMTVSFTKERIKKLPKEFTAYKVVKKVCGKFYPPIYPDVQVKTHNVAPPTGRFLYPTIGPRYTPYFHSYRTQAACDAVSDFNVRNNRPDYTYIKIRIRRSHVTCVGGYGETNKTQYLTIISKEYTTDFEEYIPRKQEQSQ